MLYTEIALSACCGCCCYCSSTSQSLTTSFRKVAVVWVSHFRSNHLPCTFFLFFPGKTQCPTFSYEEHNNCPTCRYNTYPTIPGCSQTNVSDSASQSLSRVYCWHWPGGRSHRMILFLLLLLHRKILLLLPLLHRKNRPRLRRLPPRRKSLKSILRLPKPPQSLPLPTQESR